MRMPNANLAGALLVTLVAATALPALAESRDVERQLRDQLRQTTLDLRSAQDENAQLKAKLQSQAAPVAPVVVEKAPAALDTAPLRRSLQAEKARSDQLRQQLDALQKEQQAWHEGYQKAAAVAKDRDAAAQKYQALYEEAAGSTKSCEDKNAQLVDIGELLLRRYRDKGMWQALRADEPLTGIPRIQLEQFAQEYHARIVDLKAAPATVPAASSGESDK